MTIDQKDQLHWPLLGNTPVKRLLQSAVNHQKVAPGYLFVGPAHVGKFTAASMFASSLLCQSKGTRRPCNQCSACDQFTKGLHPDVDIILPTDQRTISIASIRSLQHKMSLRSFLTEYKVAIIKNAECMTEESSNALLKTLEEPAPKTVFILTTETKEHLPTTIVSRCQVVHFNLTPSYQIENYLITRNVDKKRALAAAHFSQGRPGIAMTLIENEQPIHEYQERIQAINKALKSNISEKLNFAQSLTHDQSEQNTIDEIEQTLDSWVSYFRDTLYQCLNPNISRNQTIVPGNKNNPIYFEPTKISLNIGKILSAKERLSRNANPKLVIENLILSL